MSNYEPFINQLSVDLSSFFESFENKLRFPFFDSTYFESVDSWVVLPDELLLERDTFISSNLERFSDVDYSDAYSFYCYRVCISCFLDAGFFVKLGDFDIQLVTLDDLDSDLDDVTIIFSSSSNERHFFECLQIFCEKTDTLNFGFLCDFVFRHLVGDDTSGKGVFV